MALFLLNLDSEDHTWGPNPGKEEMETMAALTAVDLIKQAHPEIMTRMWSTEKNDSKIIPPGPATGILIGSSIGSLLWIGIILALYKLF